MVGFRQVAGAIQKLQKEGRVTRDTVYEYLINKKSHTTKAGLAHILKTAAEKNLVKVDNVGGLKLQSSYAESSSIPNQNEEYPSLVSSLKIPGKTAIVSGAAQGIGRAIAIALAQQVLKYLGSSTGANVVCLDLESKRAEAEKTVEMLQRTSEQERCPAFGLFLAVDVTKRDEIDQAIRDTLFEFGSLDISVSVVGGGPAGGRSLLLEQSEDQYLDQGHGGKIIIIGSIMANFSAPSCAAYTMSKCAIRQFAKTLAGEVAKHKINVNVIQPGYIDTPGERVLASEEEMKNSARTIPMKRLGKPMDIGHLAGFLCSPAAEYITGSVIDCDGGYLAALALPGISQTAGSANKSGAGQ